MSSMAALLDLANSASDYYAECISLPLFSGFLTLAGFSFTIHTFVVFKLKDYVDSDKYKDVVKSINADRQEGDEEFNPYSPLANLSTMMSSSTTWCFWAAIANLLCPAIPIGGLLIGSAFSIYGFIRFFKCFRAGKRNMDRLLTA